MQSELSVENVIIYAKIHAFFEIQFFFEKKFFLKKGSNCISG